jgi:hypothetical protein
MWNDKDCDERRIGARQLISIWILVAAILGTSAAWSGARQLFHFVGSMVSDQSQASLKPETATTALVTDGD